MVESALLKAEWINSTIVSGLTILVASLLIRLTRKDIISVMEVELPVRWVNYLMLPITIAHLYFGINFNIWVRHIVINDKDNAKGVFEALTGRGPLFFNGLVERLQIVEGPFGPIFLMDTSDPTTWLAHFAAIAAFIILIRWRGLTGFGRLRSVLFALMIVVVNWLIGGGWAVHASCLNRPDICRPLFQ